MSKQELEAHIKYLEDRLEEEKRNVDILEQREARQLALVILGIITEASIKGGSYIASWSIANALEGIGYRDVSMATQLPGTKYDEALKSLIDYEFVEELPELHYRYRLKR